MSRLMSRLQSATTALGAALVLGSVGALTAQADAGTGATKTGQFFTVTCEGGDERMAEQALAVVEPVWPLVCAAFGVAAKQPKQPLLVVLYRTVDGYLKADQRLTGGKFQPNQAMSHWDSLSAHVALQPPCDDAVLQQHGLPLQTQAMLCWEACHIARFELCPNFRVHPGWFHDGLAATTAQRVLHDLHPEMGEQPFFTQRWWRARRLVDAGQMPKVAALLADNTEGLEMRDRYAARIAFFEFAQRQHSDKLQAVAKTIRRTGAGSSYAAKVAQEAERLLGSLSDEFEQTVAQRQPAWDEQIRSLWLIGSEWRQMAFADSNAIAFAREPVRGGKFAASGAVFVHAGKCRQMNFLFAKTDLGFYSLAITADRGWTLFDYDQPNNAWRIIASGLEPDCKAGVDVPFAVRGAGTKLGIELAGRSWQLDLPRDLPDEIIWGVGAQAPSQGGRAGSYGIWRKVTVTGG